MPPHGFELMYSPWDSTPVITTVTIGAALFIVFGIWQRFSSLPMLPGYMFSGKVLRQDNSATNLTVPSVSPFLHHRSRWSRLLLPRCLLAT